MSYNITVEGGTSVRLPVAGRWCDRDIVVTATGVAVPDPRELYQRVEWIKSDGTQYIITDAYADNDTGVDMVAEFPELEDRVPMGSREDSGATRFYCVYPLSVNSIYYGFTGGSTISCKLKANTIYRLQTNFLNSRLANAYDADGTRLGGASISATLSPHSVPIAIFGYNASYGVSSKRSFTLYNARISRKNEVIRDYIPCRRIGDGAVGAYERITGTFWGNSGDGALEAGDAVEW